MTLNIQQAKLICNKFVQYRTHQIGQKVLVVICKKPMSKHCGVYMRSLVSRHACFSADKSNNAFTERICRKNIYLDYFW